MLVLLLLLGLVNENGEDHYDVDSYSGNDWKKSHRGRNQYFQRLLGDINQ